MQSSIHSAFTALAVLGLVGLLGASGCDKESALKGGDFGAAGDDGTGTNTDGGTDPGDDGGDTTDDGGNTDNPDGDAPPITSSTCDDPDDPSFCTCMKWNCGGTTVKDNSGAIRSIYCGTCTGGTYCQYTDDTGPGVGTCGGKNPLTYDWQRETIDMLISMGENDNTDIDYEVASNIDDGRGYTIGKVGFTTGTGDFILVAACYNDLKPGNILSKYWGHRDASGKATDGLIYYNEAYVTTGQNQGNTKLIDSLGSFVKDIKTAAGEADGIFDRCQDTMAAALYLSPSAKHIGELGLQSPFTVGFLYDTELNFGDDDDPGGLAGAKTVIARATADYGAGMPTDFTGKPWEESKWLGYLIKERTIVMSGDSTWKDALDQNSTWEAARRLHTGASNSPETGTDLSMNYEFVSKYKAGAKVAGTPCWPTELKTNGDTEATIYSIKPDKSSSATDQSKWTEVASDGGKTFAACPANPTP